MSKSPRKPTRRPFVQKVVFVSAILGVLWLVHPIVMAWGLRQAIASMLASQSLTLETDSIVARIGAPVQVQGIRIRKKVGTPQGTWLDVSLIEWRWASLPELLSQRGRVFSSFSARGVVGVLDLREARQDPRRDAAMVTLRELPAGIVLEDMALEIIGASARWSAREISLRLQENEIGRIQVGEGFLQIGSFARSLPASHGATAWKKGMLGLYNLEIFPGVRVDDLAFDLVNRDGPTLSMKARAFGGSLRSDIAWLDDAWDIAIWGNLLDIEQMCAFGELRGRAVGRLKEARLTFRGEPSRPAEAEASLRVVAENFRWQGRGWESLEVGASLIHRRLALATFELRQKDNRVSADGEMSLEAGWKKFAHAPFLLNVKADIRQIGDLAGLLGKPWDEAAGRMTATGTVKSQGGEWDGFLSMEASEVEFRSMQLDVLRGDAVFRRGDLEIVRCEAYSGKDELIATGNVAIAVPHHYSAALTARVADLSRPLAPLRALGAVAISAGAAQIVWQGDGTAKSHSGAFDITLRDFVSRPTPAGITGRFTGTYSPQNIYFSKFELVGPRLRFSTRATIADSGIRVDDAEIKDNAISVAEGSAFLPVNCFAMGKSEGKPGNPWGDREGYVAVRTLRDVKLGDLLRLMGQPRTVDGILRGNVEAGGMPSKPWLVAKGEVRSLNLAGHSSRLVLALAGGNALLKIDSSLKTASVPPTTLKAGIPFGLAQGEEGHWYWINPTQPISAELLCPSAPAALVQGIFPSLKRLSGDVSGRVALAGTLAQPRLDGKISLRAGHFGGVPYVPDFHAVDATVRFDGRSARIEEWNSLLGGREAKLAGEVSFAPVTVGLHLQTRGTLLHETPGIALRANLDLHLDGSSAGGVLSGIADFSPSTIARELVFSLGKAPETPLLRIPSFPALGDWNLDVKLGPTPPILWQTVRGIAEVQPTLAVRGTMASPVPLGRVTIRNLKVPLASAVADVPEVWLDFLPDEPGVPVVSASGSVEIGGNTIGLLAYGSLRDQKILLNPTSPTSDDSVMALFTTSKATFDGPLLLHPPLQLSRRAVERSRGRLWEAFDTAPWSSESPLQSTAAFYHLQSSP